MVNTLMRYHELITESSMSELAAFVQDFKTLTTADVDFDLKSERLFLTFTLNGERGTVRLKPRPTGSVGETEKKFRAKLYAAAMAVLGGRRPRSWQSALNTLRGTIHTQAIRILTNPKEWSIERLHYGDLVF